jgi:hypothetical protein
VNLAAYGNTTSALGAHDELMAPRAGTLTNLLVLMDNVASAGTGMKFTVYKNGVATALTCTIAAGGTTASDNTHTVAVAAGDLIGVRDDGGTSTNISGAAMASVLLAA